MTARMKVFLAIAKADKTAQKTIFEIFGNAILEKNGRQIVNNRAPAWEIIVGQDFSRYTLQKVHTAWSSICYKISVQNKYDSPDHLFFEKKGSKATLVSTKMKAFVCLIRSGKWAIWLFQSKKPGKIPPCGGAKYQWAFGWCPVPGCETCGPS